MNHTYLRSIDYEQNIKDENTLNTILKSANLATYYFDFLIWLDLPVG